MNSSVVGKSSILNPSIPRDPPSESPCAACTVRDRAVCSVLEGEELSRLNSIMTDVSLSKGEILIDQGDEARFVFNITAGSMQLSKLLVDGRRQVTGFLFSGDFLGVSDVNEYASCAEAITDVQLCKFKRIDLEKLFKEYPKMEARLLNMVRSELAEMQEQMLLLGRKTSIERVASFLLKLSDRAAVRGDPDNPVSIPMGRAGIGDYLGLSTESVSRSLTRLKKRGLIATENKMQRISIEKREDLIELAGGY